MCGNIIMKRWVVNISQEYVKLRVRNYFFSTKSFSECTATTFSRLFKIKIVPSDDQHPSIFPSAFNSRAFYRRFALSLVKSSLMKTGAFFDGEGPGVLLGWPIYSLVSWFFWQVSTYGSLAPYVWCNVSVFVSVYYVAVRTIVLSRHGSNLARPVIIHDIIYSLLCMPSTRHCGFSGVSPDGNCAYVRWGSFTSDSKSVSQTSHLIYVVLWAPRHDIAA